MARSARTARVAVAVLAVVCALGGCVTTQEKNARTLLINARTLASESPVRVTRPNPDVKVLRAALVPAAPRAPRVDAVVVELRNLIGRPLSDLPISVAVSERHGKRIYLNGAANIDYYDTHVPLIGARATVAWVFPAVKRATVSGGRLVALVGVPHAPASTTEAVLPRISAEQDGATLADELRVTLANDSSVPQYGLQLYAVAVRGGRYVGAARRAVGELDGGRAATVLLPVLGTAANSSVALYAPPTIFK